MIKLVDYRTENALPAEMKTPERVALSYAFDQQKKRYFDRVNRLYIWADLQCVSDDKLDFLAVENRVLFYNPSLALDVKRNLIKNSVYWYMKLGTRQVMEEVIATYYPNSETRLEEWFKYDGKPYHFRVDTTAILEEDCYADLKELIFKVKNARSRFDQIRTLRHFTSTFYAAVGTVSKYKNPPVREGIATTRHIKESISIATNISIIEKQSIR